MTEQEKPESGTPEEIASRDTILSGSESEVIEITDDKTLQFSAIGGNRFELRTLLGRGGMGEAWLAYDRRLGREVVLKTIVSVLTQGEDGETFRRLFLREARCLALFRTSGIVMIHDVLEEQDGTLALVMEYVEGETLETIIARLGAGESALSLPQKVMIIRGIAEALNVAHTHGVLHRDVKPANVLLRPDGTVCLIDWGLGKQGEFRPAPEEGKTGTVVETTSIAGTPLYMSPEQLCGEALNNRTDLWSLGVLSFELLANGERPFGGQNITEITAAILMRPIPVIDDLDEELVELVSALLTKKPEERLISASEVVRQCQAFLDAEDARPRVEAARKAVSAWLAIVRKMRRLGRFVVNAERRTMTPEVIAEVRSVARTLKKLKREEPLRRETASQAVADALAHDPRPRKRDADRLSTFFRTAWEEALRRRSPSETHRFEQEFRRWNSRAALVLDQKHGVRIISNPSGAEVRLWRFEVEKTVKRGVGVKFVGTTPLSLDLPRGEWCVTVRLPGYRTVVRPFLVEPSLRLSRDIAVKLFTEEEIGGERFIHIPGGEYIIGGDAEAFASRPRQVVALRDFVIQRDPVSQGEYAAFLRALAEMSDELREKWKFGTVEEHLPLGWTDSVPPDGDDVPLFGVSFADLDCLVQWLNVEKGHRGLFLPSEDQWEAAARGPLGWWYPWGDEENDEGIPIHLNAPPRIGSPWIDTSIFGVRHLFAVSNITRNLVEFAPWSPKTHRVAARSGCFFRSGPPMDRVCSRIAVEARDALQKNPMYGGRFIRIPRPSRTSGSPL